MSGFLDWFKKHKFWLLLAAIVVYFLFQNLVSTFFGVNTLSLGAPPASRRSPSSKTFGSLGAPSGLTAERNIGIVPPRQDDYTPQPDVEDRLVIEETNLSLLVEDVVNARNKILQHARSVGGYMVTSRTSNPEDQPTATVVIRVPEENLDSTLEFLRSQAVKVVSENLSGRDVTDQYIDIEERLKTLEATKARFESILEQAEEIDDITRLTQQIINYQRQIDSLKGQQQSLEQNARLAKITIYLSTDEIALPYAPSETFRPNVIFKLAVRSLVGRLRDIATLAIWAAVYSVIWVPALVVFIGFRKWRERRKNSPSKRGEVN